MISMEMLEIVLPALAACSMVAVTHAPLGIEVLKRGIIFIDLAVAQIAGLGLTVAQLALHEPSVWSLQAAALASALLAGCFFRWVERRLPAYQEAIIGCSFVLAASMVLLLLADRPHGGEEIQHLLSGELLFLTWSDVALHAPVYAAILFCWFAFPSTRQGMAFYLMFALAITSSVQLVGVYLVFASLILPALVAAGFTQTPYKAAWSSALCAVLSGIGIAVIFDLPAGPVLVACYVGVSILVTLSAKFVSSLS